MTRQFSVSLLGMLALLCLPHVAAESAQAPASLISSSTQQQVHHALARYREIRKSGGWPSIPPGPNLEPGDRSNRISLLRQRLQLSDEHTVSNLTDVNLYDRKLEISVRAFQRRHGIHADAEIGEVTLRALNLPVQHRIRQLEDNLLRIASLLKKVNSARYVLVNIPSQELAAVSDGRVQLRSTVIVGHPDRKTPQLSSAIRAVNFHPTWHVPSGSLTRGLYATLLANTNASGNGRYTIVRAANGDEVSLSRAIEFGLQSHQIRLRQAPGPRNPLGRIRLDMPNRYAVYLHDTPTPQLFAWPDRLFSSGCVRVARIVELSAWLLQGSEWDMASIGAALHGNATQTAILRQPVPVHLVYVTAWASAAEGAGPQVHFRDDVYRKSSLRSVSSD